MPLERWWKVFQGLEADDPTIGHQGHRREDDGAIEWSRLQLLFCRDHPDAPTWTKPMLIDYLQRGNDKKNFSIA